MRLGIFGGTFDPPHLAHLILADEARYQLNLDQVLWVLTPDPPHKPSYPISAWSDRLRLLEAALDGSSVFTISRVDIDRPAPHYAYATLELLHQMQPGDELIYLMGGDSLHDLPSWKQPSRFVSNSDLIGVMRRPADMVNLDSLEQTLPGITSKIRFVEAPLIGISASEIRRRVRQGEPYRYFLPPRVFELISILGLYRSD